MGLEVFEHYECDGQMEIEDIAPEWRLTHLSLFSGIGGLDLAAEWAGFENVGQCEFADYPTKILEQHWPDVPRWRDIRTLTGVDFYERTGLRTVDVISGGFPCQPFSTAGKQRGEEDDRYLWPEMLRVISEIRPTWVIGENVVGIISMALDTTLSDLEAEGYAVQAIVLPACAIGAPHQRNRVAILGHTDNARNGALEYEDNAYGAEGNGRRQKQSQHRACGSSTDVPDTQRKLRGKKPTCGDWWDTEPNVGRVAHGIPNRVDRIKCLGNAVVPQQFYPIFHGIAKIELGTKTRI